MISQNDLERLIRREQGSHPVLSLFLDLSVNSNNQRTHQIFLNQKRAEFDELQSDRAGHHVEEIGAAFARVQEWLDDEFREENRGAAIYTEVGGAWFEAMQFPVPVPNRMVVAEKPVIAPLAQVLTAYQHHGVVLLDREHVRILSVYLGTLLDEIEVRKEPIDTASHVQAGGYSQKRYQKRKAEEMRSFFKEFAEEVERFVRRYKPEDLVVLGTEENVAKFREFLPEPVQQLVVYTGPAGVDEPAPEVMARLEPHLRAHREQEEQATLERLYERSAQDYLATAGFQATLTALQEGRVETLVVARDRQREGTRCTQCGFVFSRAMPQCPYDGGELAPVPDVVEEMVRIAQAQEAQVEFVDPNAVAELRGVGALLRF